jgi:hypothetical protein
MTGTWCQFELGFHEGADGGTVSRALTGYQNYNARLTPRDGNPLEVRIVEALDYNGSDEPGLLIVPIGEDGEMLKGAPRTFVRYEDLQRLEIY